MSTVPVAKVQFTRALRSRAFALMWIGQSISSLGNGAFSTALAWQVVVLTHSATLMGIILVAQVLPSLVFLLIGGIAADRFPRRLLLFWSDAGRGVVVLLIALLSWLHLLQAWHLIVLALIFGIVGAFFGPAFRAIPPQLVMLEDLPSANSLTELTGQVGTLVGPLLGAILVATLGPASAFGFDGFTFVVSALSLFLIRMPAQNASTQKMLLEQEKGLDETSVQPATKGIRSIVADMREGLQYVATSTWLKATIIIPAFGNAILGGALVIAFPRLVHDVYGTGVWLVGVCASAEALGFIGATVFTGQVHLRKRGMLAFLGPLLSCIAYIVLGLPLPHSIAPTIAIIASVCSGFGIGMLQMIWVTLLHQLVPNDKLGRVGSIDLLGSLGLLPIGFAVIGVLTDRIGPALIFVVGGSICLILYSIPLFLRDIREIE